MPSAGSRNKPGTSGTHVPPACESEGPPWLVRFRELYGEIRSTRDRAALDKARGEAWLLLNASISKYLRIHAARLGRISPEDLEDLAAQKSLDLLRRIISGQWDISGRDLPEIAGFLSTSARNLLLDHLRRSSRVVQSQDQDRPIWDAADHRMGGAMSATNATDVRVDRKEFTDALRNCAEQLKPRSRLIWLFRIFFDMPSKHIAVHPEINLKASHVDVILQRCRQAIRNCMQLRGYEPHDMPPGTFAALWKAFRMEASLRTHGGSW